MTDSVVEINYTPVAVVEVASPAPSVLVVADPAPQVVEIVGEGATGPAGQRGDDGLPGPSAYDVAVAAGFVGSVDQWLASLQGPAGIQGPPGPSVMGPQGPEGPAGPAGDASGLIDDTASGVDRAWSAAKVVSEIEAAKLDVRNALLDGAAGALDTLAELAAAINGDPDFAAHVSEALGNRLRIDAAQTLSAVQLAQAWLNVGLGDPDADPLAAYTAAKA